MFAYIIATNYLSCQAFVFFSAALSCKTNQALVGTLLPQKTLTIRRERALDSKVKCRPVTPAVSAPQCCAYTPAVSAPQCRPVAPLVSAPQCCARSRIDTDYSHLSQAPEWYIVRIIINLLCSDFQF